MGVNGRGSWRFGVLHVREILVLVLMDFDGCQELRVIVLRCKAEVRAVVRTHNFAVVAAKFRRCLLGAAGAVVVRSYPKRPTADSVVVGAQNPPATPRLAP